MGLGNGHGGFRAGVEALGRSIPCSFRWFGRRESRDHGQNYLRALLVHSQDRRNGENFRISGSLGLGLAALPRKEPMTVLMGSTIPGV